jgi:hypothetical protein
VGGVLGGARGGVCAFRGGVSAAAAQQEVKPTPVVTIDNLSDPLATIVEISYGDLLGELLDTVRVRAWEGRWHPFAARVALEPRAVEQPKRDRLRCGV